jgi:hypothetical protein
MNNEKKPPVPQGILVESGTCLLSRLEEAGFRLARAYKHWLGQGFSILTSWKSDQAPDENRENFQHLKLMLTSRGYAWVPLWGRWRDMKTGEVGREPSLLVPALKRDGSNDPDELRDLTLKLGHVYDQQAVLWVKPQSEEAWLYRTDTTPPKRIKVYKNIRSQKISDVFSELAHQAGRTFVFEAFEPEPEPQGWAEALCRSAEGELRSTTPPTPPSK